jgi:hypothetical protein
VPNAALEYLDDLPLQLDALLAMMEGTSDPTLLLKSISKRFVNLAKDGLNKVAWGAAAQTLNQVVVLWNNGEKEEALRITRDLRERSDKYTNLEEVTDVEKVFAENAGSRVELVLTTSLKSLPIMMRSIESGDMTTLNSAIHDADSLANALLFSGGSFLKELLFFAKLVRDLKTVKFLILQENVVSVNFVGQLLPLSVCWKAQAVALLARINQALVKHSASLAGRRLCLSRRVNADIATSRSAFTLPL